MGRTYVAAVEAVTGTPADDVDGGVATEITGNVAIQEEGKGSRTTDFGGTRPEEAVYVDGTAE
jgi:hypothetical protein